KYDPANSFGVGSAGAYCKDALSGIRQFCEAGAEEKAAVKKAITKYTCNYVAKMSTDDFKKTGMKIGGGGLTVNIHWETGNLYSNVREYLENHL
ncbi:MAG: hypothetical protein NT027_03440, partial [Proteobacteria bacterium]|nr:hypothetical protein [Pseudomonadota bacterium]